MTSEASHYIETEQMTSGTDIDVGSRVVIGLSSSECFSFSFGSDELPKNCLAGHSASRNRLLYQIEESVPFDADDMAVDHHSHSAGVMVVACGSEEVVDCIDRLQRGGTFISGVTPRALLAIEYLGTSKELARFDCIVWQEDGSADVLELEDGVPWCWQWCQAGDKVVNALASQDSTQERTLEVLAVDCDERTVSALRTLGNVKERAIDQRTAAEHSSALIARGQSRARIDLRNGPFGTTDSLRPIRSSVTFFVGAMILAQAFLATALWWRVAQYSASAKASVAEQSDEFRRAFAKQPIPVGIATRLMSVHRKLAGTRGGSRKVPVTHSVLPVAHKLLSCLPEPIDCRYQLSRISLEANRVAALSGIAGDFAVLETISTRLASGGFDVPPISSEQLSQGVSLRIESMGIQDANESESEGNRK